jgi:hypothetical protein
MHQWSFCTKRANPALVATSMNQWRYVYAMPNDAMDIIAVMDNNATSDFSSPVIVDNQVLGTVNQGMGLYTPQPFSLESLDDGTSVILTNQENALIRYVGRITDTSKFSAKFVDALAWLLASHLAGPVIKGDAGMKMSQVCYRAFIASFNSAATSDANNQRRDINQSVSWMVNR